ncbi:MAG: CRISPR-associated endonuclease Cas2 [Butyrivibrio crossotus]|nr:CRISPR-associated endonuclease Cas2 [Butyrivibrio crossotus]
MRLLVVLSPTDKWGTKAEYTKLRKFLQRDGYIRIAPEVYMRIVQNRKASEKQYMVTGKADYQEKTVGVNCHIVI